jgi:hypothetical protein
MRIRVRTTQVTQTMREARADVSPPTVQVVSALVVANPLAGLGKVDDLSELEQLGADAATHLVADALAGLTAYGFNADQVRGYGKGAIVGTDGDREHTAAVLHPRFGAPVRAAIGGGTDIIPGTKLVAGPGTLLTMPIGNKDDRWVFDDMDAATVQLVDAPRADELLIALVLSVGGRPGARVVKP